MLDQGTILLQRSAGRAEVVLRAGRGGAARLARLHQSGAAKAMLPRIHAPEPEIVFLNTSGGLTGGDVLSYRVELAAEARAAATTQTAERVYDCGGIAGTVSVSLVIGRGGRLDWLPQETILYDGAVLDRRTHVALDAGASCLLVEVLVFGRRAMGETVPAVRLRDRREVLRGGRPILVEPLRLDGCAGTGPAMLRGAGAVASLALVAEGAEDAAGAADAISVDGVEAAASGWDGRLGVRAFAKDAMPLRRYLVALLERLRGRPAPRVWQS